MSDAVEAQIQLVRRRIVRQEQLVANASEIGAKAAVGSVLSVIARKNFARHSRDLADSKKVLAELLALVPQTDLESVAPPVPLGHSGPGSVSASATFGAPVQKNRRPA